jgi:hypothetical protein
MDNDSDSDEQWQDDSQWSKRATLSAPRAERTAAQVVTFEQDELDAIREAAERAGLRTSEYIRQAAAEKVKREKHTGARTRSA